MWGAPGVCISGMIHIYGLLWSELDLLWINSGIGRCFHKRWLQFRRRGLDPLYFGAIITVHAIMGGPGEREVVQASPHHHVSPHSDHVLSCMHIFPSLLTWWAW